jgi:predicted SAM-dependent methyltransferase
MQVIIAKLSICADQEFDWRFCLQDFFDLLLNYIRYAMPKRYVQYGCGWCAPLSWENYDASPTLQFECIPFLGKLYTKNNQRFPENVIFGDIVAGLPVKNDTCTGVYCSHVLEHLALDEFRTALKNTYKILRPGGLFRVVLPDLEFMAKNYLSDLSSDAALGFMKSTLLGRETRIRNLVGLVFDCLGNSHHLWLWDYKSLENELQNVGFKNIRRAWFNDSTDSEFKAVEDNARWQDNLGIECEK